MIKIHQYYDIYDNNFLDAFKPYFIIDIKYTYNILEWNSEYIYLYIYIYIYIYRFIKY